MRSRVGNIGAVKIHDLSGAAVSPTEAPRFQPFVPTVTDRPEVAQKKLEQFREALKSQIKETLDYYGPQNGFQPYNTPRAQEFLKSFSTQVAPAAPTTEGGEKTPKLSSDQASAYDAWLKANPNATPDQLNAFVHSIGIENIPNAAEVLRVYKKTGKFVSGAEAEVRPDISDVRGGKNTQIQDTINAGVRGVADTVSLGSADKLIALGDTVFKGGTYDQNLNRQYAISDYDAANHPFARFGGEALGGAVLPMGEMSSLGQIALKGAAVGGGYGVGSSRHVADIVPNALAGAAVGAAVPSIFGKVFKPKAPGAIDPLVDPVTGELNQPMVESMNPAERVATMRDYGLKTITPGMAGGRTARITEQVLNNLPASAGHMEDVYGVASKELRNSMQGVAQQFGQSKTLHEGGSELQSGANQWLSRAQKVDKDVYDAIPISPKAPTTNEATIGYLQANTEKFASNPGVQEELKDPKLASFLSAIQQHGFNWEDLKAFRSYVGAKGGQFRFTMDPLKEDYRGLYAALTEDMRNSAAAQGPQALRKFERANNFHAQMESRIEDSLVRILGKDAQKNPTEAAATVQAMTKGSKADLKTLGEIRASTIRSGAWDEIASTLIHLGGQPAGSEGRAFQPATFVNWYADMSEPARKMLFKPDLRQSLDGFVAMNQQLGRVRALNNNSNTGPLVMGGAQLLQFGKMLMSADLTGIAIQVGANAANYALAKAWTTPKFVNLVTGLGKAVAAGNKGAVQARTSRLAQFAVKNPEFSVPVQAMLRAISNDNFVGPLAASPDSNQEQPNQ